MEKCNNEKLWHALEKLIHVASSRKGNREEARKYIAELALKGENIENEYLMEHAVWGLEKSYQAEGHDANAAGALSIMKISEIKAGGDTPFERMPIIYTTLMDAIGSYEDEKPERRRAVVIISEEYKKRSELMKRDFSAWTSQTIERVLLQARPKDIDFGLCFRVYSSLTQKRGLETLEKK
ncbi:hypothetical protein DRN67_04415 [Candidatus Micrarchaeota archaeon]|nr:MAG: hypothetical protein DRN67_04415 [Candidatus Micrarchaeota archaeon]